jgi:hypothetical protein
MSSISHLLRLVSLEVVTTRRSLLSQFPVPGHSSSCPLLLPRFDVPFCHCSPLGRHVVIQCIYRPGILPSFTNHTTLICLRLLFRALVLHCCAPAFWIAVARSSLSVIHRSGWRYVAVAVVSTGLAECPYNLLLTRAGYSHHTISTRLACPIRHFIGRSAPTLCWTRGLLPDRRPRAP